MLLATTADQRFWKTDEKILFLGDWCRLYSQKEVWSQLDHEILPYHWDDREKLYQDYQLLDQIYETCLPQLAGQLNELHGTDFPSRYWRIVVGPWLFNFIEILYDRYLSICTVEKSGKATHVLLPNLDLVNWAPKDFLEFKDETFKDSLNQHLFAEIIRCSGNIPYEAKDISPFNPKISNKNGLIAQKPLTRIVQKIFRGLGRLLPDQMNEIVFVHSYIKPMELCRLQLSLGQFPNPYPPILKSKYFPTSNTMRGKIELHSGTNVFETLLQRMIPSLLPTVYVEGYRDMHQRALEEFPGKPKAIYTTNALYGNEGFQFWAACNVTRGTKLITSQHGGHYGVSKWSRQETHEIKVANRYFTWGWDKNNDYRLLPMPSGQLQSRIRNLKTSTDGNILWVGMGVPRYSYWLYSAPVGPQFLNYLADQKRFGESVSDEVRRLLVYRLFVRDFDWSQKERLADMLPSVKLYDGQKSFYQQLRESRLCISNYNSTTYLETLAANIPTLIFWNPNHWELRPSAQPYFDELREAGILHDTPESAASKINDIYKDPKAWWFSSEIQKTRERFCHRFARTSPHWISEWITELNIIAGDSE